jgi:hypothetical protein
MSYFFILKLYAHVDNFVGRQSSPKVGEKGKAMKEVNTAQKAARQKCKELKGKERGQCMKAVGQGNKEARKAASGGKNKDKN